MNVSGKLSLVAALVLGMAGGANAAAVTLQGVTGAWTGVQGGKDLTGLNSSRIEWGDPVGQKRKSGYEFLAVKNEPKADLIPGERFKLGTFTHFNHAIAVGSGAKGAQLSVDIDISIGKTLQTITTVFDFDHLETLNQASTCANGGGNGRGVNANGCADRVTAVRNEAVSENFTVDGVQYAFTISGFEDMSEFWTKENADNSAMLFGRFTQVNDDSGVSPVPLPAAAWLLGAGLLGLGAASRRRKG